MDSFEKMRRMRVVSEDLKKFGLVESNDEAVRQAEEMMGNSRDKGDFFVKSHEMGGSYDRNYSEQVQASSVPNINPQQYSQSQSQSSQPSLDMEAVRGVVDMKVNVLTNDIGAIKQKMNEMIEIINLMQSSIEDLAAQKERLEVQQKLVKKDKPKQQSQAQSAPAAPAHSAPQSSAPQPERAALTQPSSRSGGYTPEDVAVDKVFYFGSK